MARPIKNNADYFPHDADMRNDTRVKAVRRKFGIEGYGVYCMLIELLTDSDFFQFKNDALAIELVAGDFDIEPDKLSSILQYLSQLDLIQIAPGTNLITCKSLENRLGALLSKRERDRDRVFAGDNPQSRVKESKGEKIKVDESKVDEGLLAPEVRDLDWFKKQIDAIWTDQLPSDKKKNLGRAIQNAWEFLSADEPRLKRIESRECKQLVSKAFSFMKPETNGQLTSRADLTNL
jgi:hypothetical protein